MRNQIFRTHLTELLGIRHPILAGGLGPGVSDGRYVAAVVNAGGMGFIVHTGYDDPDQFIDEMRICRELTGGKSFGVNLYISRVAGSVEKIIARIPQLVEHGCSVVETAGQNPAPIVPALREAGIKVIHKVPGVRYAVSVARTDVDAVIVVGNECGGHPGIYQIGTMVQAAQAPGVIDKPVIIGGGIGTGSQIAAVLAMGGAGVIMGTRMMVAEELWPSRAYKDQMVAGNGTESVVIKKILRDNHRVLANHSTAAVLALEAQGVTDFEAYRPHVTGALTREGYRTGNLATGTYDWGHAAIFADQVEPVEAIFDRLIDDAAQAVGRINAMRFLC
ncbi:NAD(P)H-dependent flavin oxidoreductase [Novosphingobium taihuense]|uniref:Nitronate monooxygenase n=1 Tax=Novosphingobium taihuense TaxID=260085 RepID=A0A7W7AC10_9SPHN|nr:nitronate monooxygenase [Novosphingobium taihuense]MBB4614243.1 nitronate monooxygenase [Novosphingobium taihuense]TWH87090.1 nitronate monooxygenase [Novosphingobium taihuense]